MVDRLLSKMLIFLIIDFKILGHVQKRSSTNHVHWKVFSVISNKFKWVIFKNFAKNSPNVHKGEMLLVTRFFRKWRSSNVWLVETVWVEYRETAFNWLFYFTTSYHLWPFVFFSEGNRLCVLRIFNVYSYPCSQQSFR